MTEFIRSIPFLTQYLQDNFDLKSLDGEVYGNYLLQLLEYPPMDPSEPVCFLIDSGFEEHEAQEFWNSLKTVSIKGHLNEEQLENLANRGILVKSPEGVYAVVAPPNDEGQEDLEIDEEEEPILPEMDWMYYVEQIETTLSTTYQLNQEFSPEAHYFSLYKTNYDINLATALLYYNYILLNSCKPCRHYLQSSCYRKDCQFQHNLQDYPCRFWLYSHCTSSSNSSGSSDSSSEVCLFAHDLLYFSDDFLAYYYSTIAPTITSTNASTTSSTIDKTIHPLSTTDTSSNIAPTADQFPTLASSSTNTTANNNNNKKGKKGSKAINSSSYKTAVQTISTTTTNTNTMTSSSSSSSSSSVSTGFRKLLGFGELLISHHFLSSSSKHHIRHNTTNTTNTNSNNSNSNSSTRLTANPSDWVVSGDSLRHDYETLRQEARQYAISRNKLLQEASIAFMSGSKDIARSLSQQGQLLNNHMKQCHIQAAKAIFRKRNTLSDLQQGTLDIHGLHIQEALDCLSELFPFYQQYEYKFLRIVTGSGHHTKGPQEGKARLQPAVRTFCEEECGLKVKEIKDTSGYVGGLLVEL